MSTPSARTGGSLDAWFKISQRGSTVRQEVVAGLTTFLAMVYSVIVVPGMLGKAGFPPAAVFVATCLVAGLGSIVMGLWANLPLAIGCAISLTAFTAFSLVLGQHISVPVALGAVFLMGVLFTVISATGIRSWILRNLPHGVAHGTGIGIGLFLLLIAANGVGLVIKNPLDGLPVALGDFATFPVIMSLVGLAVIDRSVNDLYDGTAWLQALTFGYRAADVVDLRLEGTWVKADGQQGYFLQRMTPTYASSNGRLDIWWDNRSDFNANGEKAVFFGAMYDLKNWNLPGFAIGASYVYAWDAKPATWQSNPDAYYDKNRTIEESAYSLDAVYTIQDGRAKGTMFKLHFTEYDNHSDIPSWGGGYGNIFQDERDVKFMVIAPFTIF